MHGGGVDPHFDLLFSLPMRRELAGWAIARAPDLPGAAPAVLLAPHRPIYLNYSGPVHPAAEGARRRTRPSYVRRWDRGILQVFAEEENLFRAGFVGTRMSGIVELQRSGEGWTYRYRAFSISEG
jgi:hypothetical protein